MAAELQLLDGQFGVRELVACFVRVNIDDELCEHGEPGNTPSELVYDEWCELVARVFEARAGRPRAERTASTASAASTANAASTGSDGLSAASTEPASDAGLEKAYHAWLRGVFLPAADIVLARRR